MPLSSWYMSSYTAMSAFACHFDAGYKQISVYLDGRSINLALVRVEELFQIRVEKLKDERQLLFRVNDILQPTMPIHVQK